MCQFRGIGSREDDKLMQECHENEESNIIGCTGRLFAMTKDSSGLLLLSSLEEVSWLCVHPSGSVDVVPDFVFLE